MMGNITFLYPWVLAGLLALPVIWYFLRVTPPAPKHVIFPPARFLAHLRPDEHTPSHTPWWILLMRLLIAALAIIALAHPIINEGQTLGGKGPVRLVIDNDWSAAANWNRTIKTAKNLIEKARRDNREIYITTTAPSPAQNKPYAAGPLTAAQATALIEGLPPYSWPADYQAVADIINETEKNMHNFWLSGGLNAKSSDLLFKALATHGQTRVYLPENHELPLLIRAPETKGANLSVLIDSPETIAKNTPVTIEVLSGNGRVLDLQKANIVNTTKPLEVKFDVPRNLRHEARQIRISDRQSAGSILLLDASSQRKSVGIVATTGEEEQAPLVEASYYLTRALEPYAEVETGTLSTLLEKDFGVLIMPDIGSLPPDELNELGNWISNGGLLIRFSGPNMTRGETFLTPVPLLRGERALDGVMTWDNPPTLAPFPETSPYYDLEIPDDDPILVNRQLLGEPVEGIEKMTWASLQDGTPLVTARDLDKGLLVLFHTTATPEWSNLALSGLYVQMIRRTVNLAGTKTSQIQKADGSLQPLLVLDGFGKLLQPDSAVQPVRSDLFDETAPSPITPPGIYGRAGYEKVMNLGTHVQKLRSLSANVPAGIIEKSYTEEYTKNLMPVFLLAAFIIFLLDWAIMVLMQTGAFSVRALTRTAAIIMLACILSLPAHAQDSETSKNVVHASDLYLAYVHTGVSQVDYNAHAGLQGLVEVLKRRTSVEPAGVVALNIEEDELAFFPVIYWPVTANAETLSPAAQRKVQYYLDHGGTILFDTRDQPSTPKYGSQGGSNAESLKTMLSGLNIPPLTPMPEDHVLTKTFYLLREMPGRYTNGTIWVEKQSASGRDNVSSVIIGSHDWASAWATSINNTGTSFEGGPRQGEMALRFGTNLVMYALTGNYKADQVHLPHILERLGQ